MVRVFKLSLLSVVFSVCGTIVPLSSVLAESFVAVEAGVAYSDLLSSREDYDDGLTEGGDVGYHIGVGVYRNQADSRWVYGMKVEAEDVQGNMLLSLRALDLGFLVTPRFALKGFVGAARYDLAGAAYGWRFGLGANYQFAEHWALAADFVYNDKLAIDTGGIGGDVFYDISQGLLYLQYRF
jgi:hypothetical protein